MKIPSSALVDASTHVVWKLLRRRARRASIVLLATPGIAAEPGVGCIAWDGKDLDAILGIASTLAPT